MNQKQPRSRPESAHQSDVRSRGCRIARYTPTPPAIILATGRSAKPHESSVDSGSGAGDALSPDPDVFAILLTYRMAASVSGQRIAQTRLRR